MRIWPISLAAGLLFSAAPAWASTLQGEVTESQSRWAYDGKLIVSESTVVDAEGAAHRVFQLGGSVDGIGMRMSHTPQLLQPGDQVLLDTSMARTGTGRMVERLERIVDLRRPTLSDLPEGALPFVRTENGTTQQLYWESGCTLLHLAADGAAQLEGELELEVVQDSLSEWQDKGASCSYFQLRLEGRSDAEVGFNGINLIKFREELWCRPANGDAPETCHDDAAAGLTTLFFVSDADSDRNGEILDADIEINGVNFAISDGGQSGGTSTCLADLGNTLVHELGHLIGLDHTCYAGGERLNDDQGDPIPLCSSPRLPDEIVDATMYNFQACGEVKKATIEDDDIAGFCAAYPLADDPGECKAVDIDEGTCCSVVGRGAGVGAGQYRGGLLVLGLALLLLGRARRQ